MPLYYPNGKDSPPFHSLLCKLLDPWNTPIEIAATEDLTEYHVPSGLVLCQHAGTMGALTLAFQQRADSLMDAYRNYALSKRQWPGMSEQEIKALFRFVEATGLMVPVAWPERGTTATERARFPAVIQYHVRLDLMAEKVFFGVVAPSGGIEWSREGRVGTHGGLIAYTTRTLQAQRDTLLMTLGQQETIG